MGENLMKIGYIAKYNMEVNSQLTERLEFIEATFTRRISSHSDRVYSKILAYPVDYEEIVNNAEYMKNTPGVIIVNEPFLLDDELRKKATRWAEWANKVDESEYDPFAKGENNE